MLSTKMKFTEESELCRFKKAIVNGSQTSMGKGRNKLMVAVGSAAMLHGGSTTILLLS